MYSVYAKTRDGQILKGTSQKETASEALGEAHASAKASNLEIVKATVKVLDGKSAFSISAARKADAATGDATPARRGNGAKR